MTVVLLTDVDIPMHEVARITARRNLRNEADRLDKDADHLGMSDNDRRTAAQLREAAQALRVIATSLGDKLDGKA